MSSMRQQDGLKFLVRMVISQIWQDCELVKLSLLQAEIYMMQATKDELLIRLKLIEQNTLLSEAILLIKKQLLLH
jgi:hypothetical protein